MQTSSGIDAAISKKSLEEFGVGENSVLKYLVADPVEMKDGSQLFPRQIRKVHFTPVLPERVPSPYLIAASKSCANMLELNPDESNRSEFSAVFSGNNLLPGLDKPYATVYGCHSYGQWFGQLGDGRALSIGEVYTSQANTIEGVYKTSLVDVGSIDGGLKGSDEHQAIDKESNRDRYYGNHIFELQLKGCGRSPFSRGFDGKAVVRSSVREFLGECAFLLVPIQLCIGLFRHSLVDTVRFQFCTVRSLILFQYVLTRSVRGHAPPGGPHHASAFGEYCLADVRTCCCLVFDTLVGKNMMMVDVPAIKGLLRLHSTWFPFSLFPFFLVYCRL
jgi:hypothetical protein